MKKWISLMLMLTMLLTYAAPAFAANDCYFPAYKGKSNSLVDALKSVGADSTYSARSEIAKANGVTPYSGTPAQNTRLLNLLREGKLLKPGANPSGNTGSANCYPACKSSHTSIVNALKSIGVDSSYANRQRIAAANGITGYKGSAKQNTQMLNMLKKGVLVNPDSKVDNNSNIDHTCAGYSECTENDADIYIITNDNCAIREEAHNKGKIVARGKVGQLISVNRVFLTAKKTRWCEISVIGTNKKLYIYSGNCTPHSVHSYINVLTTDNGYVDFCAVCGIAKAVTEKKSDVCDLTCLSDQVIKGSFSSYDPTFESLVAQIVVGEIPGIGTLTDARDLVGDIMNGESAWVVAADMFALFPLIGALKYADELSFIAKNSDEVAHGIKYSDEAASVVKRSNNVLWGKWSDYKKVWVNGKEYAQIGDFKYTEHAVNEFLNPSIQTNLIDGVEHSRGVPPSYVNWILTEGRELGTTRVVKEEFKNGVKRITYANGSLWVSVENGDTVVTIITKKG